MRFRASVVVGVTALALQACGGLDTQANAGALVRDSAGVTIVENQAEDGNAPFGWTLGADAALDIGSLDGPREFQLFRVRDAMRLADGRIAVLDGGSSEVRTYAEDGSFVAAWGGEGEGPGEFMRPVRMMAWPGDSVAVWDDQLMRITLFQADGAFGRTLTIPPVEGMDGPRLNHVLPNGDLVVLSRVFSSEDAANGLVRIPVVLAAVSPDGSRVADLGQHPGDEAFMSITPQTVNIVRLPGLKGYVARAAGDESLISPNERFELRYFTADGGLVRIVRVEEPARLVTDADRQAELEGRLADTPEEAHAAVRSTFSEWPMPDTFPVFSDARVDALGRTWVQRYQPRSELGPRRWVVFDSTGRALGSIDLPERLDVYEIGADYVLGRATDELGVEHAQMWRLIGR